jgi:Ca2+-dependent lipid-binding protein
MGRLNVSIIGCRHLTNSEAMGTSDPYVIVQLDKKEYKTRVVSSNLNPNFNENFMFFLNENSNSEHHVQLVVKDKDTFSDDILGIARYTVSSLEKGVSKDLQIPLTSTTGAPAGLLLIKVCAEDFSTKDILNASLNASGGGGGTNAGSYFYFSSG